MHIKNHRLVDHWYEMSKDVGGEIADLRFIVMHYTAGGSGKASRDYMLKSPTEKQKLHDANEKVYASAHVIVDRDGTCWQIVPFNRMARHAGVSRWKGRTSLNRYSIGIEIANYGWLDEQGDGSYKRPDTPRFKAKDVTLGAMRNGTQLKGWESYAAPQLAAVERVARALLSAYPSIVEIVGHEEISPGRKFDPGPAFPLQRFKNLVDSRGAGAQPADSDPAERAPETFEVTTSLNIRGGPGIVFDPLTISPLPIGTNVVKLDADGDWLFVALAADAATQGWVHGRYLRLL